LSRGSASVAASGRFDTRVTYALFFSFSYSKALPNIHRRSMVEPWIARDMENQQFTGVEDLIGALLLKSMIFPKSQNVEEFFDQCRATLSSVWSDKKEGSPIITSLKK